MQAKKRSDAYLVFGTTGACLRRQAKFYGKDSPSYNQVGVKALIDSLAYIGQSGFGSSIPILVRRDRLLVISFM